MGAQFQCPSCSRQLFYEVGDVPFQVCGFCKSRIIVPSTAVHLADYNATAMGGSRLEQRRELKLAEIQSELSAGRRIAAIALFRQYFGTELKEAKDAIELMELGVTPPMEQLRTEEAVVPYEQEITVRPNAPENKKNSAGSIIWLIVMAILAYYFYFYS